MCLRFENPRFFSSEFGPIVRLERHGQSPYHRIGGSVSRRGKQPRIQVGLPSTTVNARIFWALYRYNVLIALIALPAKPVPTLKKPMPVRLGLSHVDYLYCR